MNKINRKKYTNFDWVKFINDDLTIIEISKITGASFHTCRRYLINNGYKVNIKRTTKRQGEFWNKPRITSTIKYLRGDKLNVKKRYKASIPHYMKKYIKGIEQNEDKQGGQANGKKNIYSET